MDVLCSYLEMVDARLLHHVKGKYSELIRLLREEQFASEEAFIVRIYGKDYNLSKYEVLKSGAIRMLQALAIVSESSGKNIVRKKRNLCLKNFALGEKFLKKGIRKEGMKLVRQAYEIAVEYNFVYLVCEFSSMLYHDHMVYRPNSRKAAFYADQMEKYGQSYIAEKKAAYYFLQATKKGRGGKGSKYAENLKNGITAIENLEGTSLICLIYKSSLEVLHGFSVADYPTTIKSCTRILAVFNSRKGAYTSHYQFFLTKLAIAQMAIGNYKQANESFSKVEKYVPARSFNDYLLRLYQTVNALYSGDYELAYTLYRKNKKCRFESIRQQFAIIEAYLCFLSHMGFLELKHIFRLGKYLNDTIASQANKQGENIAILIAELLIYLARDRGKYIDRIEAIKNYSYRHLKGKETERAKRFIKILCNLPYYNFHPVALTRHMDNHVKYLRDNPVQIGENFIEFIPFDKLLEMILSRLERKAV